MPSIRSVKHYGWKPSLPDHRDIKLHIAPYRLKQTFPKVFSLRPKMPNVYQQAALGSCTAQAVGGAFHYREMNDANLQRLIVPSRLFIYYNTRAFSGEQAVDSGASIRDAVKSVATYGAPAEPVWPYVIKRFAVKPPKAAYQQAIKYKAVKYARVDQTLESIKACVVNGDPIVFGSSVFESFESDQVAHNGLVPMPGPHEACVGGHAELIVGFDDNRGCFEVRNSWGPKWGDRGYCWFPYGYLTNPNLADDFWTIQEIQP